MNLTSTLLKVDLAVLSCILGLMCFVLNSLREIQKGAIEGAQQRTRIEQLIEFYGKRLDSVESWIAGNSGFRER